MNNIAAITKAMHRKEAEIAHQTAYINKVGETGAGKLYMTEYNENLRMWDEMKTKRDELKRNAVC